MLPAEVQSPAPWDAYLARLTTPPPQLATQPWLLHTLRPPASATTLKQLHMAAERAWSWEAA